ncbi:hypothetical protein D9M73_253870 [compost metagenome]
MKPCNAREIMVVGAQINQPPTISNKPIPIAPASAPFLGPNRIAEINSIDVPKWIRPPCPIGSLRLINIVATKTSAAKIAVMTKSNVFVRDFV